MHCILESMSFSSAASGDLEPLENYIGEENSTQISFCAEGRPLLLLRERVGDFSSKTLFSTVCMQSPAAVWALLG